MNWETVPPHTLLNGGADHSSLSNSSSETANINENAEKESSAHSARTNHESPVSSSGFLIKLDRYRCLRLNEKNSMCFIVVSPPPR